MSMDLSPFVYVPLALLYCTTSLAFVGSAQLSVVPCGESTAEPAVLFGSAATSTL